MSKDMRMQRKHQNQWLLSWGWLCEWFLRECWVGRTLNACKLIEVEPDGQRGLSRAVTVDDM